jgi:Rieske Fe-S protein
MLTNKDTPFSDVFDPNRIKPVASFSNFVRHNADVVKQFAGKLFTGEELDGLSGLAPGEARIVKYENHKLGIYKGEDGNVRAVNPTCTHLKCEVKWNSAETSWDCPCHGARYAPDGSVLTGPADHNLEQVKLADLVKK